MDDLTREHFEDLPWLNNAREFGPMQLFHLVTDQGAWVTIRVVKLLRQHGEWREPPIYIALTDSEIVNSAGAFDPTGWGSTPQEAINRIFPPLAGSPSGFRRKSGPISVGEKL